MTTTLSHHGQDEFDPDLARPTTHDFTNLINFWARNQFIPVWMLDRHGNFTTLYFDIEHEVVSDTPSTKDEPRYYANCHDCYVALENYFSSGIRARTIEHCQVCGVHHSPHPTPYPQG